jgi:hypothetical protein
MTTVDDTDDDLIVIFFAFALPLASCWSNGPYLGPRTETKLVPNGALIREDKLLRIGAVALHLMKCIQSCNIPTINVTAYKLAQRESVINSGFEMYPASWQDPR